MPEESLPPVLAALVDRAEIVDLCTRPHWAYDHDAWDELDEVFTETVAMPTVADAATPAFDEDAYLDDHLVSRADLKRGLAGFKSGLVTQHLVAGHRVVLSGDVAVCRAHAINVHFPAAPDGGPGSGLLAHGNEYRFDCVRTEAGWRVRGWVPWVRWSHGEAAAHDVAAKQRAWLADLTPPER